MNNYWNQPQTQNNYNNNIHNSNQPPLNSQNKCFFNNNMVNKNTFPTHNNIINLLQQLISLLQGGESDKYLNKISANQNSILNNTSSGGEPARDENGNIVTLPPQLAHLIDFPTPLPNY